MRGKLLLFGFTGFVFLALFLPAAFARQFPPSPAEPVEDSTLITMFLCGDVMTGRGIDQVLPHPSNPVIHEPYMKSARGYVELAIRANGPIPQPVSFAYIWGDALAELERIGPDLRIVNLETSITNSNDYWEGKGINYRMHPENIPCLTAAKIDFFLLRITTFLTGDIQALLRHWKR